MIPKEIEANDILVEAIISGWRFEIISTNWLGYWIVQLSSKEGKPLALLIHLDQLASICNGLRTCIDASRNPSRHPGVTNMVQTVAVELPTSVNDEGAMTIFAEWTTDPVIALNYYRDKRASGRAAIRQALHANDAMELYDRIVWVYNKFPNKQSWGRRVAT